jgi:hypothetical protein
MTERELRQDDHEWEKKNRGSNTELGTVNSARGAAAWAKKETLKIRP